MAIPLRKAADIEKLRTAGLTVAKTLQHLEQNVKSGMTLLEVENHIAAFLQRERATFVIEGVDYLKEAVRIARTTIQQTWDFEVLRDIVDVTVPASGAYKIIQETSINDPQDTFRIKKSLKEKVILYRVNICYTKRIGK